MKNSQNFNALASDKRWIGMMGVMKGVRQELSQLAPHPDRPGHKGAVLVRDDPRGAANDDRNSTLGSMIIESFLGMHFGTTIADSLNMPECARAIDWGNAVDLYDEANHDWNNGQKRATAEGGSFSDMFNITTRPKIHQSAEDKAWERYLQDLPSRKVMEQSLSALSRDLDRMQQSQTMKAQGMAFSM